MGWPRSIPPSSSSSLQTSSLPCVVYCAFRPPCHLVALDAQWSHAWLVWLRITTSCHRSRHYKEQVQLSVKTPLTSELEPLVSGTVLICNSCAKILVASLGVNNYFELILSMEAGQMSTSVRIVNNWDTCLHWGCWRVWSVLGRVHCYIALATGPLSCGNGNAYAAWWGVFGRQAWVEEKLGEKHLVSTCNVFIYALQFQ